MALGPAPAPADPSPGKSGELAARILSAIVLASGAIISAWWGGWAFALVWGLLAILVYLEWFAIAEGTSLGRGFRPHWLSLVGVALLVLITIVLGGSLLSGTRPGFLGWLLAGVAVAYALAVARAGVAHRRWHLGGMLYAGGLLVSVLLLRLSDDLGLVSIFFLFAIVWGADIGAYFTGRMFGGPKLAPMISPNKTWSGFAGGLAMGVFAGLLVIAISGHPVSFMIGFVAFLLALISVAGDLFESHMKRQFGVKDSGRLIPGHGGFMDRLDAFLFAAILAALIGAGRVGFHNVAAGLLGG
jgi:phosphatidate cytidylyltransferase